jgi:hypothetical protein
MGIFVYHKASEKAGFGGFVFGVKPYKDPSEHAMMPGARKLGELVDKNGILYDMVLIQPTDVQYDYTKPMPDSYKYLYKIADSIGENIKGRNKNKYFYNQGMKGKDLYNDILKKHVTAIREKWNSSKLEEEDMSYMYNVVSQSGGSVLDKIGYLFLDINGDGIEELLIGEIASGEWKGVIYDIYTMSDRKPVHVVSGGSRNRYFVCDDVFLCNEFSSGAGESDWIVYNLVENSAQLYPQVGFKYDDYKNKDNPWFISYNIFKDEWENVPEGIYNERKEVFNNYKRFDYIPLSNLKY